MKHKICGRHLVSHTHIQGAACAAPTPAQLILPHQPNKSASRRLISKCTYTHNLHTQCHLVNQHTSQSGTHPCKPPANLVNKNIMPDKPHSNLATSARRQHDMDAPTHPTAHHHQPHARLWPQQVSIPLTAPCCCQRRLRGHRLSLSLPTRSLPAALLSITSCPLASRCPAAC